jgi:sulfonate transport system substrate-binding protein
MKPMQVLARLFLLTAFSTLMSAFSCQLFAAEALPKEIRFGEVGGSNVASSGGRPTSAGVVALARHLGFFEQEFGKDGPKVEQVFFAGTGPAQNEALAQGVIDFGTYGGVPNVIGLAGNIPAHIVLTRRSAGAGNYYIGVRSDSPFRSVADLRGKRVTVLKGTNPYQSLVLLLESKGVREKDVNIVNLQGAEALVAFNAGAVDAVFGGVNLLILRDQGKLRILEDTRGFRAPASQSGFLVSEQFEKAYPDATRRIVKVLIKTLWWASEEKNREDLLQFIAARSLSYKYVKEDYAGSLKERHNPLIDESSVDAYKAIVRFCVERKLIRKDVEERVIRNWFRPEYQRAALKELKLEQYWSASDGKAGATGGR